MFVRHRTLNYRFDKNVQPGLHAISQHPLIRLGWGLQWIRQSKFQSNSDFYYLQHRMMFDAYAANPEDAEFYAAIAESEKFNYSQEPEYDWNQTVVLKEMTRVYNNLKSAIPVRYWYGAYVNRETHHLLIGLSLATYLNHFHFQTEMIDYIKNKDLFDTSLFSIMAHSSEEANPFEYALSLDSLPSDYIFHLLSER